MSIERISNLNPGISPESKTLTPAKRETAPAQVHDAVSLSHGKTAKHIAREVVSTAAGIGGALLNAPAGAAWGVVRGAGIAHPQDRKNLFALMMPLSFAVAGKIVGGPVGALLGVTLVKDLWSAQSSKDQGEVKRQVGKTMSDEGFAPRLQDNDHRSKLEKAEGIIAGAGIGLSKGAEVGFKRYANKGAELGEKLYDRAADKVEQLKAEIKEGIENLKDWI